MFIPGCERRMVFCQKWGLCSRAGKASEHDGVAGNFCFLASDEYSTQASVAL